MQNFHYVARDRTGRTSQGTLQASDRGDLRRLLRANGLYLLEFKKGAVVKEGDRPGLFAPRPNLQDLVIATRQLGTTIRSGFPLIEALAIVGGQTNKPALREAFDDLSQGVSKGQYLSECMRRHPDIFSRLIVSLVEAGETSGTLDQTLEFAAEGMDREDNLRRRVRSALLYPKLVAGACVGTIMVMLTAVVPVFTKVYSGLHTPLPLTTVALMSLSSAVTKGWWIVLSASLGLTVLFRRYRDTEKGRRAIDRLALRIPVLGPLLQKIAVARFVQTLSGSLRGGVPVLTALSISAGTAGNAIIQEAVEAATEGVREGEGIASELEKTGCFPTLATRMISTGEATGNVDGMLEEVSRFYERDIGYAVDKLTRMIEPLMTIAIGGIVTLILLALYMPIFSLGNAFLGKR